MTASQPVLIAGGGIGGLALALALAQQGRTAIVLERRAAPAAEGAGIQLGPNGVHVLRSLGLADILRPQVGEPDDLEVRDGRSGRVLTRLPLGGWLAARHGAPYWSVRRDDLHSVLQAAVAANPLVEVGFDRDVVAVEQTENQVIARCANGEAIAGAGLIGADGLWSSVRRLVVPDAALRFVGSTATRALIPAREAGALSRQSVGLWLATGVHIVHYPVRQGDQIAVVMIASETWQDTKWDAPADPLQMRSKLAAFHRDLAAVLETVVDWRKWALQSLDVLPTWTNGRVALMGDAAHPMLPHLAQGGVMALEDAVVLARCLSRIGEEPAGLLGYEHQRKPRATRVQKLSQRNGRIYQMRPPISWARNGFMRLLPGHRVVAGLDWLYGWRFESS